MDVISRPSIRSAVAKRGGPCGNATELPMASSCLRDGPPGTPEGPRVPAGAVSRIAARRQDFRVLLVGDGAKRAELQSLATRLGIGPR